MRSCAPNGGGMEYGSRGYFDVVSASAISGEGTRGGDRMWGVPDVTSGPRWPVYVRCCARDRPCRRIDQPRIEAVLCGFPGHIAVVEQVLG